MIWYVHSLFMFLNESWSIRRWDFKVGPFNLIGQLCSRQQVFMNCLPSNFEQGLIITLYLQFQWLKSGQLNVFMVVQAWVKLNVLSTQNTKTIEEMIFLLTTLVSGQIVLFVKTCWKYLWRSPRMTLLLQQRL